MNRGLWCPIKTHVTNLSGGSYNEDTKLQCAVEYCSMASVVGFGGGMIRAPWSNLLNNQIKSNHFSLNGLSWDFWFLGLFLNFWPPPRSRIRAPWSNLLYNQIISAWIGFPRCCQQYHSQKFFFFFTIRLCNKRWYGRNYYETRPFFIFKAFYWLSVVFHVF